MDKRRVGPQTLRQDDFVKDPSNALRLAERDGAVVIVDDRRKTQSFICTPSDSPSIAEMIDA